MLLRTVRVAVPGIPQGDECHGPTITVGVNGVTEIESDSYGFVRVTGKRQDYVIWPQNVAWAVELVPASSQPQPADESVGADLLPPKAEDSPGDTLVRSSSTVEHDAVNVGDSGPNPEDGALNLGSSSKMRRAKRRQS